MPDRSRKANAEKPAIHARVRVEHVFPHQKNRHGLVIRAMGTARADAKRTLANLACNFDRLMFNERKYAGA